MTDLSEWTPLDYAPPAAMVGRHVRLDRLARGDAEALFDANRADDAMWDWLPYGPFADLRAYGDWIDWAAAREDPAFYTFRSDAGPCGVGSLMRIDRDNGVIEIGHLAFAPILQRTVAATEGLFLLADHAFASGFRRLEWKCNADNAPSLRAASRLGFTSRGRSGRRRS